MTADSPELLAARRSLPIGIFDSGVGGLTVLAALLARLPGEEYRYLGDTARLPYGTKSKGTIIRYSLQATEKLVERGVKLLVVACNTATAAALPELQKAYAPLPVIGVVEPGAAAACKVLSGKKEGGTVMVLATESTINGQAYTRAIKARRPQAEVVGVPCTLFVPLAEEGWMDGPIAEDIARRYLEPFLRPGGKPDCIVLGCTHFPPLAPAIAAVAGTDIRMVDSAATTAEAVEEELTRLGMLRPAGEAAGAAMPAAAAASAATTPAAVAPGALHFLTTDAPERFARVGGLFLRRELRAADLELVVL